jgi:putative ABC transport system permease protein
MMLWKRLAYLLPWRRRAAERDMLEELRSIAEMAEPRELGNLTLAAEDARAVWGWTRLERTGRDVRYALRTLRRSPAFTAATVLTLALGIGANTAIFTAVHAVLLHPVPADSIDRLVVVRADLPGLNLMDGGLTGSSAIDLAARRDLFAAVGGWVPASYNLTSTGESQRVAAAVTVGEFFEVFGVGPSAGNLYTREYSHTGRQFVAVLTHAFWQRAFGGDPGVIGRKLDLNGQPYEILGVLSPEFQYPRNVDLYTPMEAGTRQYQRSMTVTAIGRMLPSMAPHLLEEHVRAEGSRWVEKYGMPKNFGFALRAVPFTTFNAGQLRPVLLVLLGAAAFVLVIACANVAGLQLVRAFGHQREFAVRAALGASRWSIIRQTIVQSVVIALIGGVGALVVGYGVIDAARRFAPGHYPQLAGLSLDATVLLLTEAVAVLSGILAGMIPALRSAHLDLGENLKEATRTATAGVGQHRWLSAFAIVQTALALVLLTGSALMFQTLARLLTSDPGFRPDHVVSMEITLPPLRYPQVATANYIRQLESDLQHLPAIESAGMTSNLPLSGRTNSSPFTIVGRPGGFGDEQRHANMHMVTAGFFRAMQIPLLRGRMFAAEDSPNAPLVCLIDQKLARQFFGGEDPIGQQVSQGSPATIIGIVGSVIQDEVGQPTKATIYYSLQQYPVNSLAIVIRSHNETMAVMGAVKSVLAGIDRHVAAYKVRPVRELVDDSLGPRRLVLWVLSAFAGLALMLALLGIYGVVSYSVAERTQEIGIRMALGASAHEVIAMIMRQGAVLTSVGVILGVAASAMLTQFLIALLYGVSPVDPVTFGISIGIVLLAGLAGSWVPSRRAVTISPIRALRHG